MTTSETLRAAAQYIREHGYSHELRSGCRVCMLGALIGVDKDAALYCAPARKMLDHVTGLDFGDYGADDLQRMRWTKRDAIAALEIAADLAEPSP